MKSIFTLLSVLAIFLAQTTSYSLYRGARSTLGLSNQIRRSTLQPIARGYHTSQPSFLQPIARGYHTSQPSFLQPIARGYHASQPPTAQFSTNLDKHDLSNSSFHDYLKNNLEKDIETAIKKEIANRRSNRIAALFGTLITLPIGKLLISIKKKIKTY